jgi:hypothetical protein
MSILPVAAEFLFSDPPFPWCHAATIAETPGGLVTAWFAGTAEFNPDTGIWLARASYRPAIQVSKTPDRVGTGCQVCSPGDRYAKSPRGSRKGRMRG